MTLLVGERTGVEAHETEDGLVVAVPVPDDFDPAALSVRVHDGLLEIRVRRQRPWPGRLNGFHPEASGV
jgi:HSP20 family molecular chaperone IbpA